MERATRSERACSRAMAIPLAAANHRRLSSVSEIAESSVGAAAGARDGGCALIERHRLRGRSARIVRAAARRIAARERVVEGKQPLAHVQEQGQHRGGGKRHHERGDGGDDGGVALKTAEWAGAVEPAIANAPMGSATTTTNRRTLGMPIKNPRKPPMRVAPRHAPPGGVAYKSSQGFRALASPSLRG